MSETSEMNDPTPDDDGQGRPADSETSRASNEDSPRQFDRVVVAARHPDSLNPLDMLERQKRSQHVLLIILRLVFMVLLMTVSLLPFVGELTDTSGTGEAPRRFTSPEFILLFTLTFAFGLAVLAVDALTPNKKLGTVFGVYLGIIAGLVGALAIGALVDLVAQSWNLTTKEDLAYIRFIKLGLGIALCYLAVSIVLTTKDDVRLIIPYVEFAKQVRGVRPLLLDTSALIDGRIDALGSTGFMDAPLIVPQFVVEELQMLADSGDRLKRSRGRRGLDMVSRLQANAFINLSIDDHDVEGRSVDQKLLAMAEEQKFRILTTDYNLNKVAQIRGVTVLNVNDLGNSLRPQVTPGESLLVEIVKHGEGATQGVGYLPDGTMVVVEDAVNMIGQTISAQVTNSLQTSAGRMIFARLEGNDARDHREPREPVASQMARSATNQPRAVARPPRPGDNDASRRNPRR